MTTKIRIALFLASLLSTGAFAQDEAAAGPDLNAAPGWKFSFYAYLWIPAQDGTMTVKGRETTSSTSVGDTLDTTLDNFKMGFSGHFEARRERLALFTDVMYIALENEELRHPDYGLGEIEFTEFIGEVGAAYAIIDKPVAGDESRRFRLEPLAGVRMYYLDLELSFDLAGSFSGDQAWADVFGGLRASVDVAERVSLFGRFDLGAGGSDFVWNAILGGEVRLGKHKHILLTGGYRWLDIDYEDGSGDDRFAFDMLLHGPFLGVGLTF